MRNIILALSVIGFCTLPAIADNTTTQPITTPTEVGTTTMPPGQYLVIDQISNKQFSLTVSSKGTMIMGPAPVNASTGLSSVGAGVTNVGNAAATAAGAAVNVPATAASSGTSMVKDLLNQGMQMGTGQLMKMEGKGALQNLLK